MTLEASNSPTDAQLSSPAAFPFQMEDAAQWEQFLCEFKEWGLRGPRWDKFDDKTLFHIYDGGTLKTAPGKHVKYTMACVREFAKQSHHKWLRPICRCGGKLWHPGRCGKKERGRFVSHAVRFLRLWHTLVEADVRSTPSWGLNVQSPQWETAFVTTFMWFQTQDPREISEALTRAHRLFDRASSAHDISASVLSILRRGLGGIYKPNGIVHFHWLDTKRPDHEVSVMLDIMALTGEINCVNWETRAYST